MVENFLTAIQQEHNTHFLQGEKTTTTHHAPVSSFFTCFAHMPTRLQIHRLNKLDTEPPGAPAYTAGRTQLLLQHNTAHNMHAAPSTRPSNPSRPGRNGATETNTGTTPSVPTPGPGTLTKQQPVHVEDTVSHLAERRHFASGRTEHRTTTTTE